MQYFFVLSLVSVAFWVVFELKEPSKIARLLAGGVTIAFVAIGAWYLGRFAEWNRHRLYPTALIEIAKELREGESAKVEAAIAQVFESGRNIDEATSIEFMQALESAKATGPSK